MLEEYFAKLNSEVANNAYEFSFDVFGLPRDHSSQEYTAELEKLRQAVQRYSDNLYQKEWNTKPQISELNDVLGEVWQSILDSDRFVSIIPTALDSFWKCQKVTEEALVIIQPDVSDLSSLTEEELMPVFLYKMSSILK